ncbi:hypothetical protein J6590_011288 [Homalodisca vitripennis]|nr:hypothetical protein J6590_011288 [Homalodisca vitripennis]
MHTLPEHYSRRTSSIPGPPKKNQHHTIIVFLEATGALRRVVQARYQEALDLAVEKERGRGPVTCPGFAAKSVSESGQIKNKV